MALCGIYKGQSCIHQMYGGIDYVCRTCCFGFTGAVQCLTLEQGTYKLQVRGAQGGTGNNSYPQYGCGGAGGYSEGCITVSSPTTIYIYVGGCGKFCTDNGALTAGGRNGGGNGSNYCTYYVAAGGGGGTDIRIGGTSLCHRRIVAGGGGGGGCYCGSPTCQLCGGWGGGTSGNGGYAYSSRYGGGGGTQTSGGAQNCNSCNVAGSFGQGGYKTSGVNGYSGGGGGGGWYGGGPGSAVSAGGGGGSGYVYNASTCSSAPSGYCHCTAFFLTNACTCCGTCSFPSISGGTETGHLGNGYAKVTGNFLSATEYVGGYIGNCKIRPYVPPVCRFGYTGSVQCATLQPGTYCFQVWGASGGNAGSVLGGKGGYSSGKYTVTGNAKTVYIYVGGVGNFSGIDCARMGGWNGGGGIINSFHTGPGLFMSTGGGASDIATLNCPMTTNNYRYIRDNASYNSRLIVAGGGGGAECCSGTSGQPGGGTDGGSYGGTQSSAGNAGENADGYVTQYAGGLGYGSSATGGHNNHAKGAVGGGGYYGGGAHAVNGNGAYGGGGSGYIGGVTGGVTCRGDSSFPAPTGGNETGHTGNGCVIIERIQ